MDAFESLVAMLLKRDGYWTTTSFKVLLKREQKIEIGRPSSPRPEIDVLAYSGKDNHLLVLSASRFWIPWASSSRMGVFILLLVTSFSPMKCTAASSCGDL